MGELLPVIERRPRTRAECEGGMRPCPWVGCKHHLALDVSGHGAIKSLHVGGRGVPVHLIKRVESEVLAETMDDFTDRLVDVLEQMPETCALDVAAWGGVTQAEVAKHIGMERQIVNMVERRALSKAQGRNKDPRAPA